MFLGSLLGSTSPVQTATELVGAELRLRSGSTLDLPVKRNHEHGLLVDTGSATFAGDALGRGDLGYVPPGLDSLTITTGDEDARLI